MKYAVITMLGALALWNAICGNVKETFSLAVVFVLLMLDDMERII